MAIDKNFIVKFVSTNPAVSATFIAKNGLGVSKASDGLKTALAQLVKSGELKVATNAAGNAVYSVKDQKQKTVAGAAMVEKSAPATTPAEKLQEVILESFEGHKIVSVGDKLFAVCPNGKRILMSKTDYIFMINGVAEFVVESALDLTRSIMEYATRNSMSTYVVKDVRTNKAVSATDIKFGDSKILAYKIEKYNKAG